MWFLDDPARLKSERSAIEGLVAEVDWLTDLHWSFDKQARVALRFTIVIGDRRYELRLTYPEFFPAAAPDVAPVDSELRISQHQYGAGGDLCLEYRPDNWEIRFTGADLIGSAYRLLSAEHPAEGEALPVRSAHSVTRGQELRSEFSRFLVTAALREFARSMPESVPSRCEVRLFSPASSVSAVLTKVTLADGSDWKSQGIPNIGHTYRGLLLRLSETDFLSVINDATGEAARNLRNMHAEDMQPPLTAYEDREFIIATDGREVRLLWQLSADKENITQFSSLDIDDDKPRLPASYESLGSKKVAVVGCGSVGTKMAVSLARSGTGDFLLVDDDIFIRKNLIRNDLDWRSMGAHKAEALAARIRRINPTATTTVRRLRVGGQEASGSASSLLSQIGACDLVVDATANPHAFNLLSAVAAEAKKPMVWCEVFAGGIGGFVARYRPGVDHPPQTMRAILRSWFRDQGVQWLGGVAIDYGSDDAAGAPLVADDGDVSVIAAHATRMAVDLLLDGNMFPQSMYVLSLKEGWKFGQPFEAYPVHGTEEFVVAPVQEFAEKDRAEAAKFIVQLIEGMRNEASPTGQD